MADNNEKKNMNISEDQLEDVSGGVIVRNNEGKKDSNTDINSQTMGIVDWIKRGHIFN